METIKTWYFFKSEDMYIQYGYGTKKGGIDMDKLA